MNKPALTLVGLAATTVAAGLLALGVIPSPFLAKESPAASISANSDWRWNLPQGFPEPLVPADNPMSEAKFQLGRHLFFDTRLSGNGSMGCGSCHFQNLAFTDGKAVATGSTGDLTSRGAMSIANVAYYPTLTWANPSQYTLEIQAGVPMFVENLAVELGINDENKATVLARFQNDADYQRRFKEAFPGEPINYLNIIKAISAFERGVISGNSRFDQAQAGSATLTDTEERGRKLFFSEQAQCSSCHSGFNFSDQTVSIASPLSDKPFHNTGLYNVDGKGAYPDNNPGVIAVLPQEASNMGKFRVPSLRNIEVTAPYMHDGTLANLQDVLAFYAAGGRNITSGPNQGDGRKNPFKDARLDKIRLSADEQADLIAFLKTLTDQAFLNNPRFADPFKTTSPSAQQSLAKQ
ncbi:methanobactin export MATE transporter MbnM [Rhodoferax sp.]|uniref:methanobactin export MATE transporter MbnM n=1 Tax=Rhodoferax sp. TaxID=50421 RepID=UPI002615FFFB|nr:methanobactin export MATE transporter MbnM [Rhodoferax sp.]MDD2810962.1 di-heme enzyme [Rhodoferax sp.]MDD4942409.1 di-heme enzyme [Rhodoferax sp.]MDD5479565.1 di-heme enzyme [Rhodoferax sp.]